MPDHPLTEALQWALNPDGTVTDAAAVWWLRPSEFPDGTMEAALDAAAFIVDRVVNGGLPNGDALVVAMIVGARMQADLQRPGPRHGPAAMLDAEAKAAMDASDEEEHARLAADELAVRDAQEARR